MQKQLEKKKKERKAYKEMSLTLMSDLFIYLSSIYRLDEQNRKTKEFFVYYDRYETAIEYAENQTDKHICWILFRGNS